MRLLFASLALLVLTVPVVGQAFANPPPAEGGAKAEIDPSAKRITGSENYFPTFGLRASIARGFNVVGVLAVDCGLDIPDAKMRKKADALKPRLISGMRDAVLSYASLAYVPGDKPDADMLRARLQKAVDLVLGSGQAKVALASVIVFQN